MSQPTSLVMSRTLLYVAMLIVLLAVCVGAYRGASPILLAVGFIGEIVLVSTVHLSSVIQEASFGPQRGRP